MKINVITYTGHIAALKTVKNLGASPQGIFKKLIFDFEASL